MGINTDAVQRLYVAYFNRPADPAGLTFWESKLSSTTAATQAQLTTLADGFSNSAEYTALYAGQTNEQRVNSLYNNLFGRAAETAGLTHWAGRLTAGSETFASIALQLTYSAQGTDATVIANKLSAANAFTTAIDTNAEIAGYSGTAAAAYARSWLATVTDSAASLAAATTGVSLAVIATAAAAAAAVATNAAAAAAAAAAVAADTAAAAVAAGNATVAAVAAANAAAAATAATAANDAAAAAVAAAAAAAAAAATSAAGPTLIATAAATDNLSGTVGKDTFVVSYLQDGTGTFNIGDAFNGNAGSDTLIIVPIGIAAITPADTYWTNVSNIEKIVITTTGAGVQTITTGANFNTAFAASGVDLTTTSGAGAINIDMQTVPFTGTATITTTSIDGAQTIKTGSGAATVTATNTTAGAQTISGAGLTTVTATAGADGAQTIGDAIGGGANLVTVIATASAGAQTITSTSGAAVTVTATSGAGATTIVTGAGNDIITLLATDAAGANTITGNAGADTILLVAGGFAATDTIVIGNADSGITVATADKISGFATGIDKLKMGTAGASTGVAASDNYIEATSEVASFAAALTAANIQLAALATANTGDLEAYAFQWDITNGYLFNDTDGNGTADQVVVLVGITGAGIAAADIIA